MEPVFDCTDSECTCADDPGPVAHLWAVFPVCCFGYMQRDGGAATWLPTHVYLR